MGYVVIFNCGEPRSIIRVPINYEDNETRVLSNFRIYLAKPYPNANPITSNQTSWSYWEDTVTI